MSQRGAHIFQFSAVNTNQITKLLCRQLHKHGSFIGDLKMHRTSQTQASLLLCPVTKKFINVLFLWTQL